MTERFKKRNALIYAGYAVAAVLLTAYFAVVTFPYDQVKDTILPSLIKDLPFSIEVQNLAATPFLSIRASNVRICERSFGPDGTRRVYFALDTLRLRPSLLSLVVGKKAVAFHAQGYGGTADGTVGSRGSSLMISGRWKHLSLGRYERPAESLKLDGKCSGELDLRIPRGNPAQTEGSISLRISDGSIQNLQVYSMTLPSLTGITGASTIRLQKETNKESAVAVLQECTLAGKEVSISLNGEVRLSRSILQSRLAIKGNLKLMEEFASRYDTMLQGFLRNKNKDGSYPFSLTGTLAQPRFGV